MNPKAKLSDIIAHAQRLLETHGDLPVAMLADRYNHRIEFITTSKWDIEDSIILFDKDKDKVSESYYFIGG